MRKPSRPQRRLDARIDVRTIALKMARLSAVPSKSALYRAASAAAEARDRDAVLGALDLDSLSSGGPENLVADLLVLLETCTAAAIGLADAVGEEPVDILRILWTNDPDEVTSWR